MSFSGHSGAVYALDFDGKFIYSAAADKFVVRWNIDTGEQDKFAIKFDATPYSISLFNHGLFLAVGLSSGSLHLFDIENRREVKFYATHKSGVFSITENKKLKQLIVGDASGNISVWDTHTFEQIIFLPGDIGKIRCILPTNDCNSFYVTSQNGDIRKISGITFNEEVQFFAHSNGATALLELSNTLVTAGKDAHISVWDKSNFEKLKHIPAHNFVIYKLLQLNETLVLSASRDKSIKVWNSNSMKVLQKLERKNDGHSHSVNDLVKISKSKFASCSDDGKIIIWAI